MIGVFGGTFDPVHFGHLRPALDLLQGLGLQEVRLIPCRQPPHRDTPQATPEQRLAMLEAAVAGVAGLCIDTRELRREGPSYMVDTLRSLRQELGQTPLCLLLGSDAFAGLESWYQWQHIVELAHIVVASRAGETVPLIQGVAARCAAVVVDDVAPMRGRPGGCIYHYNVTQMEISASRIRALIAAGEAADFLLPDAVLRMIFQLGLYGAQRAGVAG